MDYVKIIRQIFFKLLITIKVIITNISNLKNVNIILPTIDYVVNLYYNYCGLSPCTVDLDDQTTMHFWVSTHRRLDFPNLVLIHGCGGNSRLQFVQQIGSLSKSFNIYMPDLLFFGKSYSKCKDRSPQLQAKCLTEGLKLGFGVERFSVCSLSYGGWVGYRMAQLYPQQLEKLIIVSSGIGSTMDQKRELLKEIGMPIEELVVPRHPNAARMLVKRSLYKHDLTWLPNLFFWETIRINEDKYREEKEGLIQYLMSEEAESQLSPLSQEALLVWGDQDMLFPASHVAYQLQSLLGPKARLEILKDTGHAVNMDAPKELTQFIKSFILQQQGDL